MKRIFLYIIVSILCGISYAQDSIVVYQGTNTQKFLLSDIDSITHTGNNINIIHNYRRNAFVVSAIDSIALNNREVKEIEDITITNVIDWSAIHEAIEGYKLVSLQQEMGISPEIQSVQTPTCNCNTPQVMLLLNANDEIIMMSKGAYNDGDINVINAHSTAIALVTMHPIFGYVSSDDYETLIQLIISSPYFEALETQIAISIEKGASLFVDNNEVLSAFSTLMEDLTSTDLENSDETLDILQSRAAPRNRALNIGSLTDIGPFEMELRNGFLLVTPRFNTPFYEGSVTSVHGTEPLNIQSGDRLGILSMFVQSAGQQILFNFNNRPEGEYRFHFDRTTLSASADLVLHVLGDVLDVLGLPGSLTNEVNLVNEIMLRSAQFDLANGDVAQIIEITTSALLTYTQTPAFQNWMIRNGIRESARNYIQRAVPIMGWYQAVRGSANTIARISLWLNSPRIIDFRLCYNEGVVSACTEVKLEKYSGDNQEGYRGERLLKALEVLVLTYADDGTLIEDRDNYYRVKYSVESGGGRLSWDEANVSYGFATTYWWLGNEDTEQKVRACVVDIATGQEISEPVYFTAKVSEKTNITFRLDWDRTLSKTDIDLHVECSKGHHIFYQSMSCPCGGQLDRDDRQGPGPEHIVFSNAEPGDYIVYVHHYDSESHGSIGYTLTTKANERTYRNVGSVSYHAYGQKYKLTISPNTSNSRRRSPKVEFERIEGEFDPMPVLPPKK